MKFLCDRCKTRYSIGDDRVRGKILKIRCKNCANVITVREGMTDVDAADPAPRRTTKATTEAPAIEQQVPNGQGALGAAFASALTTKPPAALEEEWYVSIDGEQSGPFSLADAQRWVSEKAYDADLHCWSEGFDDWLPVDKVSHFRGLRKKPIAPPTIPAPAAPPAIPSLARGAGLGGTPAHRMASAPQTQKIDESEPKPLFAATMASLERSVPSSPAAGLSLPSLNGNGAARATPPGGHGALPAIAKPANGAPALRVPAIAATPAPAPIAPPLPVAPSLPANGPSVSAKGTASKTAFDVGDQATMIEAPPFDDEALTAAEPAARKKREDIVAAAAAAAFPPLRPQPAPAAAQSSFDDSDDDELQIGEVSRVVKLADLMATAKPKRAETTGGVAPTRASGPIATGNRTGAVPRLGNTGAVPRINATGAVPRLNATGAVSRIDDPSAALADPALGEVSAEQAIVPAVHENHRRGLFILITVAGLLLAGAIAAVLMLLSGDDSGISTLGRSDTIDTTRPDDPNRPRVATDDPKTGSATNPFFPPKVPVRPKNPNTNTVQTPVDTVDPNAQKLSGDDVESMARSQSATTQRCYMRAQRGADAILIGDVKKINVTIEVAPDGTVKTVGLSAHADNTLGKCLSSAIRGWKFRTSPGGTYRFALVFSSG